MNGGEISLIKPNVYKTSFRDKRPSIVNNPEKIIDYVISGDASYCYILSFDELTGYDCELITDKSKPHNEDMVFSFFEMKYIFDNDLHKKIKHRTRKKHNEIYAQNNPVAVID